MDELQGPSVYPNTTDKSDTFQQIREDSIIPLFIITCLFGIALILFGSAAFEYPWQGATLGLALMIIPLLSFLFHEGYRLATLYLILADWILVVFAAIFLLPQQPVYCFLAIPAILATLLLGQWTGLSVSLGLLLTSFVIVQKWPAILTLPSFIIEVLLISTVLFITWLASHILEDIVIWSLQSYNRGQIELTKVREYQSELTQAVKDLTDANAQLARVNQVLDSARQQAEEAQRVKTEFAANVSHELRTPLNMIIGFSEAILNAPAMYGGSLPPALLADISAIYRNSQHLTNLINDVLDISQIEARRMSLSKEWVTVKEIVIEAVTAVQPMLELHGLYLKTNILDFVPPIYCDRTRIRQVLLNLLSNAGRFTEKGGISVEVGMDDRNLTVRVTDTGPGIVESDIPKLFEPFRQLDGSIRRRQGGSGLGLNISKSFIELHGGTMGVTSDIGKGTTVWFTLPLKEELKAGNVGRWINSEWKPRRRSTLAPDAHVIPRIVILEPDEFLSREAVRYLDEAEIEMANTPEQVKDLLKAGQAQVILVRGESNEETQSWIQKLSDARMRIPIIGCTLPNRLSGESLGIAGYLMKPISPRKLVDTISSIGRPIRSILLVEDDADALQLFSRILSSKPHKYKVLQARSGIEALELMCKRKPDLVLLDIVMPGMDGFAVLAEKNKDPHLKDIPVLVLSATDPNGQPIMIPAIQATRTGGVSIPEFFRSAMTLSEEMLIS